MTVRERKGFTLVEVMLSICILSIGLVLVLQGFTQSLNVLKISEDTLKATLVAENKMAETFILAKGDFGKLESGIRERFDFEQLECEWDVEADEVKIEWVMEEEEPSFELETEEQEKLYQINASLSWEEGRRKGTIPIVTYMRKPLEEELSGVFSK